MTTTEPRREKVVVGESAINTIMVLPFVKMSGPEYLKYELVDNGEGNGKRTIRLSVRETLIVPQQHFVKSEYLRVGTEPQTKEAFESALREWRTGSFKTGSDPGGETGTKFLRMYAWRPSPTLNWKILGCSASREHFQQYSDCYGDNIRYYYEEKRDREGNVIHAQVPFVNVVVNVCPRLEVIMLGYRYCVLVLNRIVNDYDTDRCGGDFGKKEEERLKTEEQKAEVQKNIQSLWKIFSIMKNVITPILAAWATLEKPVPAAELTEECSLMMQSLITGVRLTYAARLQRLHYEVAAAKETRAQTVQSLRNKKFADPQAFRTDPFDLMYGHTIERWAKLYMGVSNAFLEVDAYYNGPLSLRFGDRACPKDIVLEFYSPTEPPIVKRFRDYVSENLLLYLTRSLYFYLLVHDKKLEVYGEEFGYRDPSDVTVLSKRSKSHYGEYTEVKKRIMALSQVGLAATRPLIESNGIHANYARKVESRFEGVIFAAFPRITDSDFGGMMSERSDLSEMSEHEKNEKDLGPGMYEQLRQKHTRSKPDQHEKEEQDESGDKSKGRVMEHYRVCDLNGLKKYMKEIRDLFHLSESNFLLETKTIPDEVRKYIYFYPCEPAGFRTSSYLKDSGILFELKTSDIRSTGSGANQSSGSKGAGKKEGKMKAKDKWRNLVRKSKFES